MQGVIGFLQQLFQVLPSARLGMADAQGQALLRRTIEGPQAGAQALQHGVRIAITGGQYEELSTTEACNQVIPAELCPQHARGYQRQVLGRPAVVALHLQVEQQAGRIALA